MAKLNGVKELGNGAIQIDGKVYRVLENSTNVKVGDIVKNVSEVGGSFNIGEYFAITDVLGGEFEFFDNDSDDRCRDFDDSDFEIYTLAYDSTADVTTIQIDTPVHLIITNVASIEVRKAEC